MNQLEIIVNISIKQQMINKINKELETMKDEDVKLILKNHRWNICQKILKLKDRICPLWETLPNHDCSECPHADDSCIMINPNRATDYINGD